MDKAFERRLQRAEDALKPGVPTWEEYREAEAFAGRFDISGLRHRLGWARSDEEPVRADPDLLEEAREVIARWQEAHNVLYDAEQGRREVLDLLARARRTRERGGE